jgi:hypothetical protein
MNEITEKNPGESGTGTNEESHTRRLGRRSLGIGAAAAGVGVAASLVARPEVASAQDTPVELGETNTATATTEVNTSFGDGLKAQTTQNGQSGVYGVDASSSGGQGVLGSSTSGTGVKGQTTNNDLYAVWGDDTSSGGGVGVFGSSDNGTGVYGKTAGDGVYGVFGESLDEGGGAGVYGTCVAGYGVYGSLGSGGFAAVYGFDETTDGAIGVSAASINGVALGVYGVATFSRSGLATVAANKTSVTVTEVALTDTSMVLATVQGNVKKVSVEGVVVDPGASQFTIHLTKAPTASLSVAWFVIG